MKRKTMGFTFLFISILMYIDVDEYVNLCLSLLHYGRVRNNNNRKVRQNKGRNEKEEKEVGESKSCKYSAHIYLFMFTSHRSERAVRTIVIWL